MQTRGWIWVPLQQKSNTIKETLKSLQLTFTSETRKYLVAYRVLGCPFSKENILLKRNF